MQYNECKACGAKDGRAGVLINGECLGCRLKPRSPVSETRSRSDVIADYIGTTIDDILDECPYWKMAPGDTEPLWAEIRDAIMAKVFAVEHEMGRAELHAEQVVENCL